MHPQGFNDNSGLRASDADRDSAASVINSALAEGRLTAEEHSERLDAIYAAKTHADLVPLLSDLPSTSGAPVPAQAALQPAGARRRGRIIAILSGATRKGAWHPDPVINVVTVLGGAEFDFREAILPGNEVVIRAISILGGVELTVPPEMRVIDNGVAILGGREMAGQSSESPGAEAPVLRIEGFCLLGGIEVKRKPRRAQRGQQDAQDTSLLGGWPGLAQARYDRREWRHQLHQQHHDLRHQLRDQRRDLRRGWTGDDED
jgi:Domain of unknown function (DUF1707)/Cell wall-active antibiotics response 4TMS YvqF